MPMSCNQTRVVCVCVRVGSECHIIAQCGTHLLGYLGHRAAAGERVSPWGVVVIVVLDHARRRAAPSPAAHLTRVSRSLTRHTTHTTHTSKSMADEPEHLAAVSRWAPR
jgi:hypothetical protein